jgi:hypothetical protein
MGDLVPRKTMVSMGAKAAGGLLSGTAVLLIGSVPLIGYLVAAAAILIGAVNLKDPTEKKESIGLMIGGGILAGITAGFFGGLGSFLLGASGIGLLAYGGFHLYKFFKNLKTRREG